LPSEPPMHLRGLHTPAGPSASKPTES
jgi:hypothetical protein